MNADVLGPLTMFLLTLLIGLPLGKYMAKVYANEKTFLDFIMRPVEKLIFRIAGIDADKEQNATRLKGNLVRASVDMV